MKFHGGHNTLARTKIFTLCDSCNQEFEIKFKPRKDYVVIGYNCPYCGEPNARWLRIETYDTSEENVKTK